jgi:hypothetical protein
MRGTAAAATMAALRVDHGEQPCAREHTAELSQRLRPRLGKRRDVADQHEVEAAIVEGQLGHLAPRRLARAGIDDLQLRGESIEAVGEGALGLAQQEHAAPLCVGLEINSERQVGVDAW